MPSIVVIRSEMSKPSIWMKWFDKTFDNTIAWAYDERLKAYHAGDIYLSIREGAVAFEDMSETFFYDQTTETWMQIAGKKELRYGHYAMASLEAEFIHICNGQCVRDYRNYGEEMAETDFGDAPTFETWADACDYIDDELLNG